MEKKEHFLIRITCIDTKDVLVLIRKEAAHLPPIIKARHTVRSLHFSYVISVGTISAQDHRYAVYPLVPSKLKQAAEERGIVQAISIETIRYILDEAKITYQHSQT
jgi:hypothetical protein